MTTTRPNITTVLSIIIATLCIAITAQATAPQKVTIYEEAGSCTKEEIQELRKRFPAATEIICIEDNDVLEVIPAPLPRREAEVTETRQPRFGATASITTASGTAIFTARFRVKVVRPATLETTCGHAINLSGTDGDIGAQIALGMSTKCLLEAHLPGDVGTSTTQIATATK